MATKKATAPKARPQRRNRVFLHAWTSGPRYLKAVARERCGVIWTDRLPTCQRRSTGPPARRQLRAMGHSPPGRIYS